MDSYWTASFKWVQRVKEPTKIAEQGKPVSHVLPPFPSTFCIVFLFQHNWIYIPPKQNSQTYVGFRWPYLRQSQSKIWMCLKEGLCNLNQSYLKIPKFISQILICAPGSRLGMWTAHPQCPLGYPPGTSTWPPILPHLPSPPVAFHVSANSITISVAQTKNSDVIWLLFFLYLQENLTISAFKIYLEWNPSLHLLHYHLILVSKSERFHLNHSHSTIPQVLRMKSPKLEGWSLIFLFKALPWPPTSHLYHGLQGSPCPGPSQYPWFHSYHSHSMLPYSRLADHLAASWTHQAHDDPRSFATACNPSSPVLSFSSSGLCSNATLSERPVLSTPYKMLSFTFLLPFKSFFLQSTSHHLILRVCLLSLSHHKNVSSEDQGHYGEKVIHSQEIQSWGGAYGVSTCMTASCGSHRVVRGRNEYDTLRRSICIFFPSGSAKK